MSTVYSEAREEWKPLDIMFMTDRGETYINNKIQQRLLLRNILFEMLYVDIWLNPDR